VDYEKFVKNIKLWNEYDLAGYLVLGSNSETVFLNEEEKLKLIELTVENAAEDKMVMVGTGMESTRETISLTNKAAQLGADCALILTPFYYGGKMNDDALISYYREVADNVTIPILIYNVTKFTHVNISKNAIKELSKHENIIGMKDSSGSIPQLVDFKSVVEDKKFNLMIGTASAWYPALQLGVVGSVMALANCSPQECIDIQSLFDKGEFEKSCQIYTKMFPVNQAVTGEFGIAGLKYACDLLGYEGGHVRSPLKQLKAEDKNKVKAILDNAELIK